VLPRSEPPNPTHQKRKPGVQDRSAGQERRTGAQELCPRQVDSEATVFLVDLSVRIGVRIRGRILDICLGGCRIPAAEERRECGACQRGNGDAGRAFVINA
jgi:hypothetical protein